MDRINFFEIADYTFYELCRREHEATTFEMIADTLSSFKGTTEEAV